MTIGIQRSSCSDVGTGSDVSQGTESRLVQRTCHSDAHGTRLRVFISENKASLILSSHAKSRKHVIDR